MLGIFTRQIRKLKINKKIMPNYFFSAIKETASEEVVISEEETPVYLKPFDENKYRIPSSKIKVF